MATYEKANVEVLDRVQCMAEKYHGDLVEQHVTFDCLFAFASVDDSGTPKGDAVSLNGYPCQATIKIISAKDRVAGRADAELLIDKSNWDDLSQEERDALIDHELEHLELRRDKKSDRPSLKIKKHDHQFGWFDSVARRHAEASAEVIQATDFITGAVMQLWLPGLEDNATLAKAVVKSQARNDVTSVTFSTKDKSVTMSAGKFRTAADSLLAKQRK